MEKQAPKQTTLGTAFLITNLVLPIGGAYLYFVKGMPRLTVIEGLVVACVILNAYYLIAFKVWGEKPK